MLAAREQTEVHWLLFPVARLRHYAGSSATRRRLPSRFQFLEQTLAVLI